LLEICVICHVRAVVPVQSSVQRAKMLHKIVPVAKQFKNMTDWQSKDRTA